MSDLDDKSTKLKPVRSAGRTRGLRVVTFWSGGSASYELLPGAELSVGRVDGCDVQIHDESVSRQHAVLRGGPPASIEDLESANGTFVGDRKLPARVAVPLEPSTVVELGDALLLLRASDVEHEPEPAPVADRSLLDTNMTAVHELVNLVAKTTIPVLLLGETGVGKGVIAEGIHKRSGRHGASFLRLNCAAIPEPMLESELFGHERGAFTGATDAKPGLLEAASGGTVLLDEIGDMPLAAQAKLLHALDHDEVLRVGALKPRPIDVRFIAVTNRDLLADIDVGKFRQDLYFRLNGVTITVPPLRERQSEIPFLARSFVAEASSRIGCAPVEITSAALERLQAHAWPGNVRELRNVMIRATLFARGGRIGVEHFEPAASGVVQPRAATALRGQVRDLELRRVAEALAECGQNQVEAAKRLGISRNTLRSRMKELGLLPSTQKS